MKSPLYFQTYCKNKEDRDHIRNKAIILRGLYSEHQERKTSTYEALLYAIETTINKLQKDQSLPPTR